MKYLGIIIVSIIATVGALAIIHHVMSAQDEADKAGVRFTKMNDGLFRDAFGSLPLNVTDCERLRDNNNRVLNASEVIDCYLVGVPIITE